MSSDMNADHARLVADRIAMLRPPSGYAVREQEWEQWMRDAALGGCDWVSDMQEHNPLLAQSIDDAAALLRDVREVLEIVSERYNHAWHGGERLAALLARMPKESPR